MRPEGRRRCSRSHATQSQTTPKEGPTSFEKAQRWAAEQHARRTRPVPRLVFRKLRTPLCLMTVSGLDSGRDCVDGGGADEAELHVLTRPLPVVSHPCAVCHGQDCLVCCVHWCGAFFHGTKAELNIGDRDRAAARGPISAGSIGSTTHVNLTGMLECGYLGGTRRSARGEVGSPSWSRSARSRTIPI